MSLEQLEVLNKQQELLQQKITAIFLQLGVEYKEDKIAQLTKMLLKRIKVKNSYEPYKKMIEIQKQRNDLSQVLIETKKVLDQVQEKIQSFKISKQQKLRDLQVCQKKILLIQEIVRQRKQIQDLIIENEKYEHYFDHIKKFMEQKMKESFDEDASTLQKIHLQINKQQKQIQKQINQIKKQNLKFKQMINKQKFQAQELRKIQVQLNKNIQKLKMQNQTRRLFRDRQKSKKQMQLFSNTNSENQIQTQQKPSSSLPNHIQRVVKIPINQWKRVSSYVISFGIYTTILCGYYIISYN